MSNSSGKMSLHLHYVLSRPLLPILLLQLTSFVFPWLVTIYFSRKYGLFEAGEFSFLLAVLAPIVVLFASPSRNYLLSLITIDTNSALVVRGILFFVGLIISVVIGVYFQFLLLAIALYCVKISEMLFDIPVAVQLIESRCLQLWRLAISKFFILFIAVIAVIFFSSIETIMFLIAVAFVSVSLYYLKPINISRQLTNVGLYVRCSFPLTLSALLFSLQFNVPRYVLAESSQHTVLAVYAMSSYLVLPFIIVLNGFMQSQMPKIVQMCRRGRRQRFRVSAYVILTVLMAALFLQIGKIDYIFTPFWQLHNSSVMINPELLELYFQVVTLGFAPLLFSSVNYLLIANGQHKTLLIITLISTVMCWALSYFGVSNYGSIGVVWGYAAGCVLHTFMVMTVFLKKRN